MHNVIVVSDGFWWCCWCRSLHWWATRIREFVCMCLFIVSSKSFTGLIYRVFYVCSWFYNRNRPSWYNTANQRNSETGTDKKKRVYRVCGSSLGVHVFMWQCTRHYLSASHMTWPKSPVSPGTAHKYDRVARHMRTRTQTKTRDNDPWNEIRDQMQIVIVESHIWLYHGFVWCIVSALVYECCVVRVMCMNVSLHRECR